MINTTKALELINKEFLKKYGKDHKLKPGQAMVAILNNCTMVVVMKKDKTLGLEFTGIKPFVIDESLDMYSEENRNDNERC